MILYHYTSKDSYENIIKTQQWNPSNGFVQQDSAYGHGWYMTDITPDQCYGWIVAYCWQRIDSEIFGKVEYFLKFEVPDSMAPKKRDHVFLIKYPESSWSGDLNPYGIVRYLDGGKVGKCSTSVFCWICNKIQKIKQHFGWR